VSLHVSLVGFSACCLKVVLFHCQQPYTAGGAPADLFLQPP